MGEQKIGTKKLAFFKVLASSYDTREALTMAEILRSSIVNDKFFVTVMGAFNHKWGSKNPNNIHLVEQYGSLSTSNIEVLKCFQNLVEKQQDIGG